jgi:hypothetical protein
MGPIVLTLLQGYALAFSYRAGSSNRKVPGHLQIYRPLTWQNWWAVRVSISPPWD